MKRAENELILGGIIYRISNDNKLKREVFYLPESFTFYSAVISHSYYCIFNGAKAYLLSKGIMLSNTQGQHQNVYHKFKNKVIKGVVGDELVKIYGDVKVKVEELLEILESERKKRGEFTYEKLPQANMKPAEESLENAKKFYRNIKALIG